MTGIVKIHLSRAKGACTRIGICSIKKMGCEKLH